MRVFKTTLLVFALALGGIALAASLGGDDIGIAFNHGEFD